jgi:4-carboxymuconolactone decarboxylase
MISHFSDNPPPARQGRYELTERASLSQDQRVLYDRIVNGPRKAQNGQVPIVDDRGRLLGPFGLMTIAPGVGEAVQSVGSALRFGSGLSPRIREIAILVIAARFRSEFEWFAHEPAASAAGITGHQLDQLKAGSIPEDLSADEATAAGLIESMLAQHTLTDAEYSTALQALGEQSLAELVWLCGYYSMLALSLNVFLPENPLAAGRTIF